MLSGNTLRIRVNNTVGVKLFMFYPGDEILTIFDYYPYSLIQPIVIDPQNAETFIMMKLRARREDWSLENRLIGI